MSDMRLIVAGAGGRMGRTLIHAITAIDGAVVAGAVEARGSAVIGRDAGELAGLGKNGITVTAEVEPLLEKADGLVDFTVPAATMVFAELTARKGLVHVIGTTGLSGEKDRKSTRLNSSHVAISYAVFCLKKKKNKKKKLNYIKKNTKKNQTNK